MTDHRIGADELGDVVATIVVAMAPEPSSDARDADLVDDLAYHSIALVELSLTLEELFGLEPMELEEALGIQSVGDIVRYVSDRVAEGAGAMPSTEDWMAWQQRVSLP